MKPKDFFEEDGTPKKDFLNFLFALLLTPFVLIFYVYKRAIYFYEYVFKKEE